MPASNVIILMGVSGSGKTTVCNAQSIIIRLGSSIVTGIQEVTLMARASTMRRRF